MCVGLRSRSHIAPFALHRPNSWAAAQALHDASPAAAYLAGGLDLIDWLKQGNELRDVIRLDGIPGYDRIEAGAAGYRIGAGATLAAIAAHPGLPFAAGCATIANPRVRHVGTIGGNVMSCQSDYDGLPALLACDASAELADGTILPLAELSCGLVTAFHVPYGYEVRADRSLRPALSVWVGVCGSRRRAAIGMAYRRAICVEAALPDLPAPDLPAPDLPARDLPVLPDLPEPLDDGRASAAYRRRMIGVLVGRLLR